MMMTKSYAYVAGRNFFYTTPFLGGKHSSSEGKHPIFTGKQTFHKRDTVLFVCQLLFLEGEEGQFFGEQFPHPKVDGTLVFR